MNTHFSSSKASQLFSITTMAEERNTTNLGQSTDLAMHPAPTAPQLLSSQRTVGNHCHGDRRQCWKEICPVIKLLRPLPLSRALRDAEYNIVPNFFLNKYVTSKNYSVDSPSSIFTQA